MIRGTNDQTYADLMLSFLPRPIATESDYEDNEIEIDRLLDKGELSAAEQDYLHLLGTLVFDFESRTEDVRAYELRGVALVKGLMALHDLKQKDLIPIFKAKSIVSDVLNGKRRLTVEHIDRLAVFFGLPHEVFFEPADSPASDL